VLSAIGNLVPVPASSGTGPATRPVSLTLSTAPRTHPSLLFGDIRETPGYRYRNRTPWSGWEAGILKSAKASLTRDFSRSLGSYNREGYRAGFASDLGLAYQITKQPEFALKAREALLAIGTGDASKTDRATALAGYSLAYDWVEQTLSPADNAAIRDRLATLADTVYGELNNNGTWRHVIQFADYHGQAYPAMGIAGCVLSDYTSTGSLHLSSTPADWFRVGTYDLFVDDELHDTGGRSLFSYGFDESSGKFLNGAYKFYVTDDFLRWFQVYGHVTGRNIFDDYPAARRGFTAELWDSLPDFYSANYVTLGDTRWTYPEGILNLLDNETRSEVLAYLDRAKGPDLLPYSRTLSSAPGYLLYLTREDYSGVEHHVPPWTSRLDPGAVYQVFRGSWADDADWLSLVTFNTVTWSNRDAGHNDQLSAEYYSHGDLLLADAGEDKEVLDKYYGVFEIHHNTIAIEDPRSPFPPSSWTGTGARGIFKGTGDGIATPVTFDAVIEEPWMDMVEAGATIRQVVGTGFGSSLSLSSPIAYTRSILFPGKEYFIVVDRLEGTEPWVYRTIFRPASLNITPTSGSTIGNVRGSLSIDGRPFDWLSLPYKAETGTGPAADGFTWTTVNPYGKAVTLELFTNPASEDLVIKHVGRVAGYDRQNDVYSPVISFRSPAARDLYRITVLLPHYNGEQPASPSDLPVTGQGSAVLVRAAQHEDTAYSGTGLSSFGSFETDARTLYCRVSGEPVACTMTRGTFVKYAGTDILRVSPEVSSVSFSSEANRTILDVTSSAPGARISLAVRGRPANVLLDGSSSVNWTLSGNLVGFTPGEGEHLAVIGEIPG